MTTHAPSAASPAARGTPPPWPVVSICINNYNYGHFLRHAIESALGQTYDRVEVVVVDDGSTDDSVEVIASYGDRIVPVLKENGGQGSAFNAGFEAASGDVVIFLDADDALLSNVAAQVAEAFRREPDLATVQYRLEVIDSQGRPTGIVRPSRPGVMPNGDLSRHALRYRCYHWQPTSGNAYSAKALARILPVPEDAYRISADAYVSELIVFCGPVRSLEDVGGRYRVHASNNYNASTVDAAFFRRKIDQIVRGHENVRRLAPRLGLEHPPEDATDAYDVAFLGFRLASLKLDPAAHPVAGDTALSLMLRGIAAALLNRQLRWTDRVRRSLWFALVGPAPSPLAAAVIRRYTPDIPRRAVVAVPATTIVLSGNGLQWGNGHRGPVKISICINNWNYAQFLAAAIDSALGQTYDRVEVVVVDDGSTDESRDIIESYGDKVVAIFKENGGHASAFNAGFAAATGDAVIFLDADDRLLPHTAQLVADAFADPGVAMVQYRLEVIDAEGRRTGEVRPKRGGLMPSGDLSQHVLRFRSYHWQPTSCLAFSAAGLRHIMPMPEQRYRRWGESYLAELIVFCGRVRSLDDIGAQYRLHGGNSYATLVPDATLFERMVRHIVAGHEDVLRFTQRLGIEGCPEHATDRLDAALLGFRLASLKLDREHHPLGDERVIDVAARGVQATLVHPHFGVKHRLRRLGWFLTVAPAPRPVAGALIRRYTPDLHSSQRRSFTRRPESVGGRAPAARPTAQRGECHVVDTGRHELAGTLDPVFPGGG